LHIIHIANINMLLIYYIKRKSNWSCYPSYEGCWLHFPLYMVYETLDYMNYKHILHTSKK